jgi:folate-binding protein YgfZ
VSAALDRPGAVAADPPDVGVAAHYGDPLREQRLIETGAGWVDRSHRDVIRITGPDRHSWLHNLTTQHFEGFPDGRGTEALVLSPQGHVEHHLVVAEIDDVMWVDVEPGTGEALVEFLESMRFMLRVDVEKRSDVALVSVAGPDTMAVLDAAGLAIGSDDYAVSRADDVVVRRMPWPTSVAADVLVPREDLAGLLTRLDAAGANAAGVWAFEALRVAAHRPRLGVDTDHRTLPHEVGWIDTAVHLAKGCYRGQETVARVHNLGRPPRRLVMLHLDGSGERLPVTGDPIEHGTSVVGQVGTVARHYELGPIGLGLVRRSTPVDVSLVVGGVAASAEVIVDPEAGLHIRPEVRAR